MTWKTNKQDIVSLFSAEAEYRAMSVALKELKWLKQLFQSFGIPHPLPTKIYCDSKSALHIDAIFMNVQSMLKEVVNGACYVEESAGRYTY